MRCKPWFLHLRQVNEPERKAFAARAAKVLSLAANQFNLGLRAYYFAMALLTGLVSPWILMLASVGVVLILYRREFHSDVLQVKVFTPTQSSPLEQYGDSSVV